MNKALKLFPTLLLLMQLNPQPLQSQTYFNKNYEFNGFPGSFITPLEFSNNYYLVGVVYDFPTQRFGTHFFKLSINGDSLFSKPFYKFQFVFSGGASRSSLLKDSFVFFTGSESFGGNPDIVLYKFNLQGDTIWTRVYGGPNGENGNRIIQTPDSGFAIIGWTQSFGNGQSDFYLLKVDSLGNQQWLKTYGTSGSEDAISGQLTLDGGFILSGRNNSNQFFIVKTDSAGNQIWTKSYTNTKGACFIVQLPDSGFILSGTTQPSGFEKGCLIKTDKNGNLIWQKNYGGISGNNLLYAIPILLWDGSIVCSGVEQTGGAVYGWLLKTDALGNQMWSRTYYKNQSGNNEIYDVKHTSDNGFIMSGYTMMGSQDPWLVKVDSNGCLAPNCNVGIFEFDPSQHFAVYPNPCKDELSLLNVPLFNATIQIFDLRGVLVRELTTAEISAEGKINISSLPSGLYSIRIISANQSWFSKVLKIE